MVGLARLAASNVEATVSALAVFLRARRGGRRTAVARGTPSSATEGGASDSQPVTAAPLWGSAQFVKPSRMTVALRQCYRGRLGKPANAAADEPTVHAGADNAGISMREPVRQDWHSRGASDCRP